MAHWAPNVGERKSYMQWLSKKFSVKSIWILILQKCSQQAKISVAHCNLSLRYVWQTGSVEVESGLGVTLRAPDPNPQLCVWNLIERRNGTDTREGGKESGILQICGVAPPRYRGHLHSFNRLFHC